MSRQNLVQPHPEITSHNQVEQVTLNQSSMDSPYDQTVLEPNPVQHFEPFDHHKTLYREEDIVSETNTIPVPNPLCHHKLKPPTLHKLSNGKV